MFRNSVLTTMQSLVAANDRAFASQGFTVVAAPPAGGTLRVVTVPPGAAVQVDGSAVGTTPLERTNVPTGLHTIRLSLAGYQVETRQVSIQAGATTTLTVTLTPIVPANQPPTASFSFTPPAPIVGQTVTFDGSASTDPDGSIVSHAWEFGDGATGTGIGTSHAYGGLGTYTVRLTVTDSRGTTDTEAHQLSVESTDQPDLLIENVTYTPAAPSVGQTVVFSIVVRNAGLARAGRFQIRLEDEPIPDAYGGVATHGTTTIVSELAPGASATVSLQLSLGATSQRFFVIADHQKEVAESQEENNTASILVGPPLAPLQAQLDVDRSAYSVGDKLVIEYRVNRSAYIYICDVWPDGRVRLVFPNIFEPTPWVGGGSHTIPAAGIPYTLRVADPIGTETLYLFASTEPISLFPTSFGPDFAVLSTDPAAFRDSVLTALRTHVASEDQAFDSLSFRIDE